MIDNLLEKYKVKAEGLRRELDSIVMPKSSLVSKFEYQGLVYDFGWEYKGKRIGFSGSELREILNIIPEYQLGLEDFLNNKIKELG